MPIRYCMKVTEVLRTQRRIRLGKLEQSTKIVPVCCICHIIPSINNDPRIIVHRRIYCAADGRKKAMREEPHLTDETFKDRYERAPFDGVRGLYCYNPPYTA